LIIPRRIGNLDYTLCAGPDFPLIHMQVRTRLNGAQLWSNGRFEIGMRDCDPAKANVRFPPEADGEFAAMGK